MIGQRSVVLVLAVLLGHAAAAAAAEAVAIGVLGDSYSDEYQFYPPDRSTSRNWVEILAATRGVDFGRFSTASLGEPRNLGFEYNWSRSDAATDDLIAGGQHTGLAVQVASGAVKYVVIFIGGNDFIHALQSADPEGALDRALPRAVANYKHALETILAASPEVRVVTATVPDIRNLPMIERAYREGRLPGALLDRYSAAIAEYNRAIRAHGRSSARVAVADFAALTRLTNRFSKEHALVMGRRLSRVQSSNQPSALFLADERHLGTLGQGLMAQMFIHALNARFGAGLAPLTDREVLDYVAGKGQGAVLSRLATPSQHLP